LKKNDTFMIKSPPLLCRQLAQSIEQSLGSNPGHCSLFSSCLLSWNLDLRNVSLSQSRDNTFTSVKTLGNALLRGLCRGT